MRRIISSIIDGYLSAAGGTRVLRMQVFISIVILLFIAGAVIWIGAAGADARSDVNAAAKVETIRYTVLLAGNPAGRQVTTKSGDSISVQYEFDDRGRGPKLDVRIIVGPHGVPTVYEVDGANYSSSPVEERFSIVNGHAEWTNAAESGEIKFNSPAFYVSLEEVPEATAILVRALLKSPNHQLRLFPEGLARLEQVGEREVNAEGQNKTISHYVITGMDLSPAQIWLDSQGEMFAQIFGPFSIVLEGWESVTPTLAAAQEEWASERQREIASRLADVPSTPIAFRGASLFDAEQGRMLSNTTVIVSGERIISVGPDDAAIVPPGARVIELAGKALLPGLWDMHAHARDRDGPLNIAAGVTSIRDLANQIEPLLDRRRRWQGLEAIGPRVAVTGIIDGKGPFAAPTDMLVDTDEEAKAAVDHYWKLGYRHIKIYSSVKKELAPVIISRARMRKMRVSGHIPSFMTAEQVVLIGFDEIHHINMLFLNFLGDTFDSRSPERFTALAELAPNLDLASDEVTALINLLAKRNIVVDPTLTVFEEMFTARPGSISPHVAMVAERFPPLVRRSYMTGGLPSAGNLDAQYQETFNAMLAMVKQLYDAGVPLVAGTDALPGFTLHRELELYVKAGIPVPEVLTIATQNAAEIAGRGDELGIVKPGFLADLIIIDGDPVADISNIRRVQLVMKNGVLYDPASLYRELSVTPWQELESSP